MANVRDYLKRKKERKEQQGRMNYREKIKSHKFMIFYRTILVVILIMAVGGALYVQWKNKVYKEKTVVFYTEVHIKQDSNLVPLSGYILTNSKDGAGSWDIRGNAVWNQNIEMQNPIVDVCQNVAAIGDYNGRTIYVMNTTGVMGSITTNRPVRDFCVASNGVVAAVLDDADTTWIYLYDSQGKELIYFRTTMKDSGYPVKVAISPSGELVCVSYLFVDSGQMKSSVAFYNFGAVGKNNVNNYVSGYDYSNSVVPLVRFLDNGSVFGVSDDRVMFFGGAQKPVSVAEKFLEDDVQGVYYGDEYIGLVFNSTQSDNRYRLDVYHKSGELRQTIEFNINFKDILFHEDQIIIYNESECCIYNSGGAEKYSGNFSRTVLLLIPQSSVRRYMVVTPDSIDTIELK